MKKIQLSIIALLASSSFMMAGGDLVPVIPYEVEEVIIPVELPPVVETAVEIKVPKVAVQPPLLPADVSGAYVALGLVAAKYDTNCDCTSEKSGDDNTGGVVIRAGYDFNKYLGIEARALATAYQPDGGKIKHGGLFLKPMLPVTNGLNAYGLVGLAKTKTTGVLRTTDVEGLAFGGGLEYDLSSDNKKEAKYGREFDGMADQEKGFGVFADYERLYYKKGSPDLDAVSVGVTYDF